MDWKKIFRISLFTLPIAIAFFWFMCSFQSHMRGGVAELVGVPVPYFYDVFETPEVEFYNPLIIILDILIIYSILTLITYLLYKPNTNTFAILSLVFAFIFFPLGLVFGIIALNQIKKTNEHGKCLAIAGIVLSCLPIILTISVIILGIVKGI